MSTQKVNWTLFKSHVDNKGLSVQYFDFDQYYGLLAFDGVMALECSLTKDGGADVTDFETNYKPYGNASLKQNINVSNFPSSTEIALPTVTVDAFGRLRVAEIHNIFESTHINTSQSEFWDEKLVGTTASTTYVANRSAVDLTVGTESGNRVVRQTKNYFHYAAGQSLLVRFTAVLGAGETNLTILNGYGDDDNGLFFCVKDGVFGVLVRTNTSGSPVDEFIPQSSFNVDTVDGNGPSGVTLDLTKTQILQIDMQWLGVGAVNFSTHIDGSQIVLHKYNQNANYKDKVYMRTAHLPVRYEIKTTGVTTQSNTLQQICTQVANEGSTQVGDIVRSVDMDTSFVSINSTSFTPVISFRVNPTYARALAAFISFNYVVTTNDDVLFRVLIDASPTGGTWTDVDGICQTKTPTSFSGGFKMGSSYVSKTGRTDAGEFTSKFRLGSTIDGDPQTVTIVAKCFSGSANVGCVILYKELF